MSYEIPEDAVDIDHGHFIKYLSWDPDLDLNPQYEGMPSGPHRVGIEVFHPNKKEPGKVCVSGLYFDIPIVREWMKCNHVWQVHSEEPLTLSPSLLCTACGDHGFVRQGKWVVA